MEYNLAFKWLIKLLYNKLEQNPSWEANSLLSIVKPTRCTSFSNLFYFVIALYMVWTVFLSIIRSSKTVHTASGICQTDSADCLLAGTRWNISFPLASSQQNLFDIYLMLCYSLRLLMMDEKTVRNQFNQFNKFHITITTSHLLSFLVLIRL